MFNIIVYYLSKVSMSSPIVNNHLVFRWEFFISLCLAMIFNLPAGAIELRSYYISCNPDQFEYIISHPEENDYIDCSLEYNNHLWRNVRIRLRGETSRAFPKKSFKINFNSNDRFFGRDKFNLISEWTDSSFSREFLAYDLYHRAGLPASQAWFARLYVNDRYMGLYLDVENVDEHFLRYGDLPDDATIYKADGNGCLMRLKDRFETVWEKKTNAETGFYDLYRLIEWVDTAPAGRFFQELSGYFDPDEIARVIAINGLMANTSTYYHNYFLIHEMERNGVWRMLPWDMDYTYFFRYNYGTPSFHDCGQKLVGTNLFIIRCWRNEDMQELIYAHMRGLIDSVFTEDYYGAMSDSLEDLLSEAVEEDEYKQYSIEQFRNGMAAFPEMISGRGERILEKLEYYPVPFDLKSAQITPDGVFLSWDPASVPNGADVFYQVWISPSIYFPPEGLIVVDPVDTNFFYYDQLQPGEYYWRVWAVTDPYRRTSALSYNSKVIVPENGFDVTVVEGTIENSTTWTRNDSPYSLPDGLTIAPDAVLTIERGVQVGIGAGQDIRVEGGLTVLGSMQDSVRFVRNDPAQRWGSINIVDPTDPVTFNYASIDGGNYLIQSNGGSLEVFDSSLRNGRRAVLTYDTQVHFERDRFEDVFEEVFATRSSTTVLKGCRFAHGPSHGESADLVDFDDLTDLTVERCDFYSYVDEGVDLDRVQRGRVEKCRISGGGDHGMTISGYECNIYVANNIITNCIKGIGISVYRGVQLYNNVIAFNDTGIVMYPFHEYPGTVSVRNSVLWRNPVEIVLQPNTEIDVSYSMIQGDTLYPGAGNHRSNGNFIDQWNRNFELREDSPLIDAGYGTGHPELDYFDAERVDVQAVDNTGAGDIPYVDIGAYEYDSVRGIPDDEYNPPASCFLVTNYPNPFNSTTRIEFDVLRKSPLSLMIYDLTGRKLFERHFDLLEPGRHSLLWGGRDDAGNRLASGLYICRVVQEAGVMTHKMVMVK